MELTKVKHYSAAFGSTVVLARPRPTVTFELSQQEPRRGECAPKDARLAGSRTNLLSRTSVVVVAVSVVVEF